MSGGYAGQPVSLSFSGAFDPGADRGSFTVSGSIGTSSLSGSGSWSYTTIDPQTIDMIWDSAANMVTSIGQIFRPDKHFIVPKRWARSADGPNWHIADSGTYRSTIAGIPFGPNLREISDEIIPMNSPRNGTVTVSLPDDGINLSGYVSLDSGNAGGQINVAVVTKGPDPGPTPTPTPTPAPGRR